MMDPARCSGLIAPRVRVISDNDYSAIPTDWCSSHTIYSA